MYGMNQAYTPPDPSAQVPNHLVSAQAAPQLSPLADRTASPRPPDILLPVPYLAESAARPGARVPHQRPADRARHVPRRLDLLRVPSSRWHRHPHMAAAAPANPLCLRWNGLGGCRDCLRHERARLCMRSIDCPFVSLYLTPLDPPSPCPQQRLHLPSRALCTARPLPLQDCSRARHHRSQPMAGALQAGRGATPDTSWPDTHRPRHTGDSTYARSAAGCRSTDAQRVHAC